MKVQELLNKKSGPIDVSQLVGQLKVNKTTVYRQLDKLVQNGVVQEINFGDGKKRYELAGRHHHHLICDSCGKIIDIDNCFPENFEKTVKIKNGFEIKRHSVEFFGLCSQCT